MPAQPGLDAATAVRIPRKSTPITREDLEDEVSRALTVLAEDQEDEADEQVEMTSADRIVAMLKTDLGERAYVRVYRYDDRSAQQTFCRDYVPAEFESNGYEMIRQDYGPGRYSIVVYGTKPGTNLFGIRGRDVLTFANPRVATAPVTPAQNDSLDRVLATIAEGQNRLLEALASRPQVDQMAEMTKMMTFMASMKEVMGVGKQEKSSIAEIIDAIKEMKGVSELIGGKPEKEDPTSQLIALGGEVIGMVKNGMGGAQQQSAAQPFPQLNIPGAVAAPVPAALSDQQLDMEDPEVLEFLTFRAYVTRVFVPMAGDDTKIDAAAELLADKMPDKLLEMMDNPSWFELLQAAAPEALPALAPVLANHREWLTKVRAHLQELLKDDPQ